MSVYLCAHFWIIVLLHQDLLDITTMPRPPDEVLTEILKFAYEKVSKINFQEYEQFVNDIVVKLKEYKENQEQMTASSIKAILVTKD